MDDRWMPTLPLYDPYLTTIDINTNISRLISAVSCHLQNL